jgi:putative ABC transport system permease protein
MFLIVVVSIVEGMDRYIREDLSAVVFGVNTVTLRRWSDGPTFEGSSDRALRRRPRLTFEDWEVVGEQITTAASVGAESQTSGEVVGDNGRTVENVRIAAISTEIMAIRDWSVEKGRPFAPQEASRGTAVVVLGTETAELLFDNLDPIGRRVRIRGFPYRVVGVLEEQGSIFGQSLDNLAIAPARSPIQAVTNPRGIVGQIVAQADDPSELRTLQVEIEGIMRARRRLRPAEDNNFSVETAEDTLSFWDKISRILFLALPGLVAISLVVGGIVIMNIMLVSVMQRTREIGVRKALGARRRDILSQVLIESITLSGVGAALGAAVGVGLTYLVGVFSPLPAAVDPKWIALGVSLGVLVGVTSGVYPASRAAKLAPVDALRHE